MPNAVNTAVTLDYPEGFDGDNCFIVGFRVKHTANNNWYSYGSAPLNNYSAVHVLINGNSKQLFASTRDSGFTTTPIEVFLMKV